MLKIYDTRANGLYGDRKIKISKEVYERVRSLMEERFRSRLFSQDGMGRTYKGDVWELRISIRKKGPKRIFLDYRSDGDLEGLEKLFGLVE